MTSPARALIVVGLLVASACGEGEEPSGPPPEASLETSAQENVKGYLEADGRFGTLVRIFQDNAPILWSRLGSPLFKHTFFAPTDLAFEALAPDALEPFLGSEEAMAPFLHQHTLASLESLESLRAYAEGSDGYFGVLAGDGFLRVVLEGGEVAVAPCHLVEGVCEVPKGAERATIIEADIAVGPGIVHVIDAVLLHPSP